MAANKVCRDFVRVGRQDDSRILAAVRDADFTFGHGVTSWGDRSYVDGLQAIKKALAVNWTQRRKKPAAFLRHRP